MPAEVLYRKWRPQRFAEVSGQELVTRTLVNAVSTDRVSHAYLFAGPRGTGKTTTARLLAKAINCEKNQKGKKNKPGEPCNACASCKAVAEGSALDLVELDGASNRGIDDIRALRENAGYLPMAGMDAHKVYLIDEVHMLTDAAFNALLKTLEEPPPHIIFILATTDIHKVPATIVSRCQRHEFKRIPTSAMADRLAFIAEQEQIEVPREGLEMISRVATGSLRDAINLMEQICDSYGNAPSLEAVREGLGLIADERAARLAQQALQGDFSGGLDTISAVRDDGLDLRQFQKEVVMRLRELLHVKSGADTEGRWTPEQVTEMQESIADVSRETLVQALRAFGQADLRADPLSPLPLELALADSTAPPPAATARAEAAPTRRPDAAPAPRSAPAPAARQAQPAPRPAPAAPASRPAPARDAERVPEDLRKDLSKASAEDIARMLGSKAPVIPPAGDEPEEAAGAPAAPASKNGGHLASTPGGNIDLETFIDQKLRPLARQKAMKFDALLNGSCKAVSYEGGVLTLGFFMDAHHKKTVEQAQTRKVYEELATQIFGEPVTIQCILAEKTPKAIKSPLVQHAVQAHGAKIVSGDEEP
ncbi:MAG TPA: DNA polymerase III subunit gamma/tau [Dehalococcoidia bacterium]|nr:DNA polymerase III subunit gamma/tau [Dehalococcoidia bacterium]